MAPDVDELIRSQMGLAQSLAQRVWRTAPHALELDEMRAIAYLGLVGAANRWLPYCQSRQFSPDAVEYFKPFVAMRVYGALMDAIRASDWATRALRTKARALQEAGQGRGLSDTELARRTGMSVAEVRATLRDMARRRPVSIQAEELDPHSQQNVESSAFTSSVLETVVRAIQQLDHDQQTVIALHYHQGLQFQQIAKAMGIAEVVVSQLHADAVITVHQAMLRTVQSREDT